MVAEEITQEQDIVDNATDDIIKKLDNGELLINTACNILKNKVSRQNNKKNIRKPIPQTTIKHLINKTKGKCEICHWGGMGLEGILIPHHIHKYTNTEDNSIENLILICPNCHNTIYTLENCKDERMIEIITNNVDLEIRSIIIDYVRIIK